MLLGQCLHIDGLGPRLLQQDAPGGGVHESVGGHAGLEAVLGGGADDGGRLEKAGVLRGQLVVEEAVVGRGPRGSSRGGRAPESSLTGDAEYLQWLTSARHIVPE